MTYSISSWNYSYLLKQHYPFEQMLEDILAEHLGVELWLATTDDTQRMLFKTQYTQRFKHISCHTAMANTYDMYMLKQEILFCQEIGSLVLVVHPRSLGIDAHTFDYVWPHSIEDRQLQLIDDVLHYAADHNVILALENGPMNVLEQVANHVGSCYPDSALGICVDTGHAALHHHKDSAYLINLLDTFHSRIVQLHLHDNMGTSDDHMVVGTGLIHWDQVAASIGTLREQIPVVFELKSTAQPMDDLRSSMQFVSKMYEAAPILV